MLLPVIIRIIGSISLLKHPAIGDCELRFSMRFGGHSYRRHNYVWKRSYYHHLISALMSLRFNGLNSTPLNSCPTHRRVPARDQRSINIIRLFRNLVLLNVSVVAWILMGDGRLFEGTNHEHVKNIINL